MSYLVTGHRGFIGCALKNKLGEDAVGVGSEIFEGLGWKNKIVRKLEEVNPQAIFHVGGVANTSANDINHIMERNYEFTKVISEWSAQRDAKVIFSSSASCYGNNGVPLNLYGWSKYTAENIVFENGGISLRYFNVYGPGEEKKKTNQSFIHQAIHKDIMKIFPGGPQRDFVYLEDVISANLSALGNFNSNKKKYYDVGFGKAVLFEDIVKLLNKKFSYLPDNKIPDNYQRYTCANPKQFLPGWKPRVCIEDGVKKMIDILSNKKN